MGAFEAIDEWDVPTAAAAVFDPDGVREERGPADEAFRLASVSKVLAAVVVHVAVEEGSIGLDDEAGPEGSTVRHLLAHASGLGPDGQVLEPPGRRRIYSNAGFEALADHVAAACGMAFADYARLGLVQSLGLEATDLSGSPAHGYASSIHDLCTVLRAVVNHRLLARPTVDAMVSPAFPELAGVLPGYGSQDPNPWGLGVEVRGDKSPHWTAPDNSVRTWGHFGQSGTFVWFDPEAGPGGLGLVVLTDRDFGPWATEAWPALAAAVLQDHR
ncbi:MAG: serine hydrolase domain-containing protein [Acidimicrobiales bacterium]